MEAWTVAMHTSMAANGWTDGRIILMHIHQKWDPQTDSQLHCLTRSAGGV